MIIGDIIHTSTVDWPGKVSLVIFTGGCNLRCCYCSNSRLWLTKNCKQMTTPQIMNDIRRATSYIDAVVFSGGEPLLQSTHIHELTEEIHKMGLLVGVNTNGTRPRELYDFDAVMLDIKAPLEAAAYHQVCHKAVDIDLIRESITRIKAMKKEGMTYWEARTVVFHGINDDRISLAKCYTHVKDADRYYVVRGSDRLSVSQLEEVSIPALRKLAEGLGGHNVYVKANGEIKI